MLEKLEQIRKAGLAALAAVDDEARLDQWRQEKAGGMDHVLFMFGKNAAGFRSAAMKDLSIPCN